MTRDEIRIQRVIDLDVVSEIVHTYIRRFCLYDRFAPLCLSLSLAGSGFYTMHRVMLVRSPAAITLVHTQRGSLRGNKGENESSSANFTIRPISSDAANATSTKVSRFYNRGTA